MHDVLGGVPLGWLVALHVLSAFGFVLVHGGSTFAALRLRHESDPARVRAVLELSGTSLAWMWVPLALLLASGALLAAVEHTWRAAWVWGSAVVFLALWGAMAALGGAPLRAMRRAAGYDFVRGKGLVLAREADVAELERLRAGFRAGLLAGVGFVGLAILAWLMVARPG